MCILIVIHIVSCLELDLIAYFLVVNTCTIIVCFLQAVEQLCILIAVYCVTPKIIYIYLSNLEYYGQTY